MKGYSALLVINVFIVVKWNAVLATESRSRIRRTKPFQSISSDSIMNNWVTNSGELNEKMNYGVEQRKAKLSLGAHNERDVKYIQHQYDNRVRSEKESNARRENTAKVYEKKRSQKIQSGRSKTKLKTTVRHSESNQRQNDDSSSPIGNKGSNDKENNGGNLNSKLEDSIMYNPLISFDDSAVDQVHEREKHTKPDFDNLDEISRLFLDEIFAFMSMATLPPTPVSN